MNIKLFLMTTCYVFINMKRNAFALEEDLMDTRTATSDIGWTMPQDSEWQEASSPDQDGDERRVLMVCRMRMARQNNWVRSPYIPVNGAKRVYIEFEFTMRSCEDVPNVATCKETFNLYYYETDRDEATSTFPPWEEASYTKVDTIAADKRFHRGTAETNLETRDIGPLRKRGIYLALQDTGACMALLHVRVYYKYCSSQLQNLALFPQTTAGPERTSLVEARGTCVDNASVNNQGSVSLYCNSGGEWAVPKGQCVCDPGFAPNQERTACTACGSGSYKPTADNSACSVCPSYSQSHTPASTACQCMPGYFRATSDPPTAACTKPPSKPTNLLAALNLTTGTLSWDRPLSDGGRGGMTFRVECEKCQDKLLFCQPCPTNLAYLPAQTDLQLTEVKVQGLRPLTNYRFKVYAENGVSEVAKKHGSIGNYATVTIATKQIAPPKMSDLYVRNVDCTSFLVMWNSASDGHDIEYQVVVTDRTTGQPIFRNLTKQTDIWVVGLSAGGSYAVKVRAVNQIGYGPYSDTVRVETSSVEATPPSIAQTDDSTRDFVSVLIGAGSGLLCVVLLLVFICYWHRKSRKNNKSSILDPEKYPMFAGSSLLSNGSYPTMQKIYVDPTTYEDPYKAMLDFTKEIDSSCVKIEAVIGEGEFGEVCSGIAMLPGNKKPRHVAIKTLKSCYGGQQKVDFLGEASIMGQFDHPNVIRLDGVVTRSRPLMIITEYMENGSLDTYLKKHDGQLNVVELVRILRDIASGMKYLSEMGYIHRDLAARNILVNSDLVCKVSDFGMSRVLEEDEDAAYTTRGGKIPIRWTAPEAITFRKFTFSSDVWSFGVVMWEVMSYGERPYWEMTNRDVMQAIESGYRLPAPMDCPLVLHQLMVDCWRKDETERPKFGIIVMALDGILLDPSQLKVVAGINGNNNGRLVPVGDGSHSPLISEVKETSTSSNNSILNPSPAEQISFMEVWLEQIGLDAYKENFFQSGYYSVEQILHFTPNDLCKVGMTEPNDQNAFLDHVYGLKVEKDASRHNPLHYQVDNGKGISV